MKNFWSFLLIFNSLLFNTKIGLSQSDTLNLHQTYQSFSNQEKAEWTAFENNWNYVEYANLKQTNNIKNLNCKNCSDFYADIYIEINEAGKLSIIEFKKGKICGQALSNETIIKDFEASLKAQTFNYLKNKRFTARFGHILKC